MRLLIRGDAGVGFKSNRGSQKMRGTRSVPLIFCFSPFEFEQRPLILNRQQPEGRLTAMFVPRSLRRGQTCATDEVQRSQLGYYRESLVQCPYPCKHGRGSQKQEPGQRPCSCFCFLLLDSTNDFVDSESAARRASQLTERSGGQLG